jgi:hypothetical protein
MTIAVVRIALNKYFKEYSSIAIMKMAKIDLSTHADTYGVAEILSVKPGTVKKWRYSNKGPKHIKIGGRYWYDLITVMEYLKNGEPI